MLKDVFLIQQNMLKLAKFQFWEFLLLFIFCRLCPNIFIFYKKKQVMCKVTPISLSFLDKYMPIMYIV